MRRPLPLLESTALLACFIMGIELLLLVGYVRIHVLCGVKALIEKHARKEILEGADDDLISLVDFKRQDVDGVYETTCGSSNRSVDSLTAVAYVLTAALFVVGVLQRFDGPGIEGAFNTAACAGAAITTVLICQWLFGKLCVLPFYAGIYNRVVGPERSIPTLEWDSPGVTATMLTPAMLAAGVTAGIVATGYYSIWRRDVLASAALACLGLVGEVLAWFLMKGFATPMASAVAATTDAATAMIWAKKTGNDNGTALKLLHDVLFVDALSDATAGNLAAHNVRTYFRKRMLVVNQQGGLESAPAPNAEGESISISIMFLSGVLLLAVPFVIVAIRAPLEEGMLFVFHVLMTMFGYAMFIHKTGKTKTMRRITSTIHA